MPQNEPPNSSSDSFFSGLDGWLGGTSDAFSPDTQQENDTEPPAAYSSADPAPLYTPSASPPRRTHEVSSGMSVWLAISLFLWVLGTAGATVILSFGGELWTTAFFFWQLIVGILAVFLPDHRRRKAAFGIFLLTDAALTGTLWYLRTGYPWCFMAMQKHCGINLMLIALFFFGLALALGRRFDNINLRRRCTETAEARIVTTVPKTISRSGQKLTVYAPVYQYTYHGTEYESVSSDFRPNGEAAVGSVKKVRINPEEPSEIHLPKQGGSLSGLGAVLGLALMAASAAAFVYLTLSTMHLMNH